VETNKASATSNEIFHSLFLFIKKLL